MHRGNRVRIISMSRPNSGLAQPEIQQHDLLRHTVYLNPQAGGRFGDLIFCTFIFMHLLLAYPHRAKQIGLSCLPFSTPKRIFTRLLRTLSSENPDVVHCHYGPNGELAVRAREVLGRNFAIVTSFHGCDLSESDEGDRYHRLFSDGDQFIANTNFTKQLISKMGCPLGRISIMPVGVDTTKFLPPERSSSGTPRRICLITVARLVEVKGLDVSIRAVAVLKQRGVEVQYRIIGNGHLQSALETLATELGVGQNVTFLGGFTRQRIVQEMASADMFVLPSVEYFGLKETQGLVIQEAQASGLPVVASNIGGIPDGITDGETGLLFPPGDSEALADCVMRLAADDQLRDRLSRQARTLVETHYDNVQIALQLEQIYREAMTHNVDFEAPRKGHT